MIYNQNTFQCRLAITNLQNIMADVSTQPYIQQKSDRIAEGVIALVIGISLILWIIQSLQTYLKPGRLIVFLLISHATIFLQCVLKAALSNDSLNSRSVFTVITILVVIGQRTIILANYFFLILIRSNQTNISRSIRLITFIITLLSGIIMIAAGIISYTTDKIDLTVRLRQLSASITLAITILFFPLWPILKSPREMKRLGVVLLIISGLASMAAGIYILVAAIPHYYNIITQNQLWFHVFQIAPIVIAQVTWTIFHPNRSFATREE